jgi:hypothetical protein
VLRVAVLRVPVLRRRVPPAELLELPDDDLPDDALRVPVLRARDVVEPVERRVVPVRLRVPPDRAARTFSTPSSISCKPSDDCSPAAVLCCSVESSVVVLNG